MKTIYNIMYLLLFVGIFTGCVADNDFIDCGLLLLKMKVSKHKLC